MNRRAFFGCLAAAVLGRRIAPAAAAGGSGAGVPELNVENLRAALNEFERMTWSTPLRIEPPRYIVTPYGMGFKFTREMLEAERALFDVGPLERRLMERSGGASITGDS